MANRNFSKLLASLVAASSVIPAIRGVKTFAGEKLDATKADINIQSDIIMDVAANLEYKLMKDVLLKLRNEPKVREELKLKFLNADILLATDVKQNNGIQYISGPVFRHWTPQYTIESLCKLVNDDMNLVKNTFESHWLTTK